MRTRMNLMGFALVLCCTAVFQPGFSDVNGPKIVFKAESWNFGKVKSGERIVYEFIFENKGDADLNITKVETACGCTAALVANDKVAPGKSGKIKVTFNTGGYEGDITKSVFIETDDPANPRLKLTITAMVDVGPVPKIELGKMGVESGLLIEGEELSAEVTIRNPGAAELQFRGELPFAEFFVNGRKAVFPVRIAAGSEAVFSAKLRLDGYKGYFNEVVLLTTNDPLRSTLPLTITGYVVKKADLKQLYEKYKSILK